MLPSAVIIGRWENVLEDLVSSANSMLTLCAPFVSDGGMDVVRRARNRSVSATCGALVLTDLSPRAIAEGATYPEAVLSIYQSLPNVRTVHLPRLHAKVYAADGRRAIITSGNLTENGLMYNHECGVVIEEVAIVRRIEGELANFASIGAEIDRFGLERLCELAIASRSAFRSRATSASRATSRRLREALRRSNDALVRAGLAGGPLHAVLGRTVEYLLRRHGPLSTAQLHPMIQAIHPDLCDDSIDRVIDGERYGKKWKHAVRTAQQQLKKRGMVTIKDGHWSLTETRRTT